ncbi:MAG: hypothetical protein BWK79_20255 [Beggiatoa sp. IS2]|nr:MAG: hypothetical protein BWK79_20255 [Beggiatoa sp. IS2]
MHKERFNEAILAHSNWKKRLKKAIETGNMELTLNEAGDSNNCSFGQWLHSKGARALPNRSELLELHRTFHEEAANILQLAVVQNLKTEAMERIAIGSRFGQLTAELVNRLAEIRDRLPD